MKKEAKMEWISVKDSLPPCVGRQRYLVIADGVERTVLYREYYNGWDFEPEYGNVTHWMPLPPPPSLSNSDYAKCSQCDFWRGSEYKRCQDCGKHFA